MEPRKIPKGAEHVLRNTKKGRQKILYGYPDRIFTIISFSTRKISLMTIALRNQCKVPLNWKCSTFCLVCLLLQIVNVSSIEIPIIQISQIPLKAEWVINDLKHLSKNSSNLTIFTPFWFHTTIYLQWSYKCSSNA